MRLRVRLLHKRFARSGVDSRDRGAAAVEAALILPVFFVVLFGIIDYSLVLKDSNEVTNAARAASRAASAQPKVVMSTDEPGFSLTTASNVNYAVVAAARSAYTSLSPGARSGLQEIWVFHSAADGSMANGTLLPSGGSSGTCTTNCVKLVWNPAMAWTDTSVSPAQVRTGGFTLGSGTWRASSINACQGDTTTLSVYIKMRHNLLFPWTQWIARSPYVDLADRAVARYEPIPISGGGTCAAS